MLLWNALYCVKSCTESRALGKTGLGKDQPKLTQFCDKNTSQSSNNTSKTLSWFKTYIVFLMNADVP